MLNSQEQSFRAFTRTKIVGELKILSQKRQTLPLLFSVRRTHCSLMLLTCRVLQLQLTYALNSVNNEVHKYNTLFNGVGGQLLDAAREDTAALVQLIMDRL